MSSISISDPFLPSHSTSTDLDTDNGILSNVAQEIAAIGSKGDGLFSWMIAPMEEPKPTSLEERFQICQQRDQAIRDIDDSIISPDAKREYEASAKVFFGRA